VEQLDRIRDPSCVAGWLATTCRRECLALLRFAGRCAPFDPVDPEAPVRMRLDGDRGGVNPADEVVARAERAAVRTAVSRLPRRQQQVVTALLDEPARGGGYAAVAADLGIPHGSLGPTRKRALRTLARDPSLR
jgi:DNA-directed RNA polymerase specialized sigma24 family protein